MTAEADREAIDLVGNTGISSLIATEARKRVHGTTQVLLLHLGVDSGGEPDVAVACTAQRNTFPKTMLLIDRAAEVRENSRRAAPKRSE